jgi:hypothetical protein
MTRRQAIPLQVHVDPRTIGVRPARTDRPSEGRSWVIRHVRARPPCQAIHGRVSQGRGEQSQPRQDRAAGCSIATWPSDVQFRDRREELPIFTGRRFRLRQASSLVRTDLRIGMCLMVVLTICARDLSAKSLHSLRDRSFPRSRNRDEPDEDDLGPENHNSRLHENWSLS